MSGAAGAEAATGPAPPVPLRRNRGFRLLWIGQVVSGTGTDAAFIAYPLLILALTHSPAIAGLVSTVAMAVELGLGLPGGALSDRLDRRLTMIICDAGRAALLALLTALVVLHLVTWLVVLAVAVIDGGAFVLFDPAAGAALSAIVADGQLEQAWARTSAGTYAAGLAGPALGGFLFGLGRAVPFAGDAASYLFSAAAVSRIRGTFRAGPAAGRKALWREIIDGLHLIWHNPLLRAVVIRAPLINFAFTGAIFTITLALRRHGTAPATIGLAQAAIGLGGLLGAMIAPRLQGRLRPPRMVIVMTTAATVLFGGAALLIPSTLVAIPVAASILLAPAANAAMLAATMRATPEEMRGRVNSTVLQASLGLTALAPLTSGLLVEHFSGHWAMAAFAAAMGTAAILAIAMPGPKNDASVAGDKGTGRDPPPG
jgi:MFS family permease